MMSSLCILTSCFPAEVEEQENDEAESYVAKHIVYFV